MIADNHFFPIEDKCIRKKLQVQVQMVNNMQVAPEDKKEDDEFVILDKEDLKKEIIELKELIKSTTRELHT